MDTLLLIDGMNLVRRIYEANLAPDSKAKAEGALRSSFNSFRRAITEHAPTHCAWAYDINRDTWHKDLYPPYKESRTPVPAPLTEELPIFKLKMENLGWAQFELPGYEADDLLTSLAIAAVRAGMQVVILSTDKDIAYLASIEGIRVYDHFKGEWRDEAWTLKKFGVKPAALLDWLALTGDSTDGIPGVDGVGAVTAAKLLTAHGSLQGVLEAAAQGKIGGKVGKNLVSQRALAELSLQLTTMRSDLFLANFDKDSLIAGRV